MSAFKLTGLLLIISFSIRISAQSIFQRKTDWTLQEARTWAQGEKQRQAGWRGWLLYRGSDSLVHHFIARWIDDFAYINIRRSELRLTDERRFSERSSAPWGYYYVDATDSFAKVKDY